MDHTINNDTIVRDLGALQGPLLVFGGVYSNFQALEAMQQVAEQMGFTPNRIICTGDIVGYCADPEACVQRIRDWGVYAIAGNVELQLRGGADNCGCNFNEGSRCDLWSRQWYPYAQSQLSASSLAWMQGLPHHLKFAYNGQTGYVLHGAWRNPSEFIFRSTPWSVKALDFEATQADFILAGHCGLPFVHQHNHNIWCNAGVIGMPANDGTPRVWYAVVNTDANGTPQCTHHALSYDHAAAADRMTANRLPAPYALTLSTGIWDNCEILPETESRAQGVPICFGETRTPALKS